MSTKKIILFVFLFATTLNASAMKRKREDLNTSTTESPFKKPRLAIETTDLKTIYQSNQLPTKQKIYPRKAKTRFLMTIDNEPQAPTIQEPVYPIEIVTIPTPEEIKAFADAMENNNFAEVKRLLKEGFNHNIILPTGYSPLEQTAQIDDEEKAMEIANLLISGGAKINPENGHSGPLHAASEEGKSNLVKLLIQCGADVNHKGNGGSTPLHLATDIGNVDTVKRLLAYNANKKIKDIYGHMPTNIINDNPWLPNKRQLVAALENPRASVFKHFGNPLLLTKKRQQTGKSNALFLLKK